MSETFTQSSAPQSFYQPHFPASMTGPNAEHDEPRVCHGPPLTEPVAGY